MAAGRGDLQRPLDMLLTFDVLEVGGVGRRVVVQAQVGAVGFDGVVIPEVGGQPAERVHRVDVDPLHQRGFGRVGLRHEDRLVA